MLGPCHFLGCQSALGNEFRFMDGDGGAWLLALICPDHEKVLREVRDLGLYPIMVTRRIIQYPGKPEGGTVWIMPDWLRGVWWPAAPGPVKGLEQ